MECVLSSEMEYAVLLGGFYKILCTRKACPLRRTGL